MTIKERKGLRRIPEYFIRLKYGFIWKKPIFLWRFFKSYLKYKLTGEIPLRYIDFAFDYRCNLKCKHCYPRGYEKLNKEYMKVEDYKKLVREAMEMGACSFEFQGGEPLLPCNINKLGKLIRVAHPNKNIITVTTNGVYLNEENLEKLRKWKVDTIVVSLDSGVPEEHDKFRGVNGTWKKATKNIDLALKKGFKVAVNTTLTKDYLRSESLLKLLKFCKERKLFVNVLYPAVTGAWAGNMDILLGKDDFKYLEKLREEYPYLRRAVDSLICGFGCPAAKEEIHITAHGEVQACPFIQVTYGNVKEESFKDIIKRIKKLKYFKTYWPLCPIAEDKEFIKKYYEMSKNKAKPINYEEAEFLNPGE